MTKYTSVMIFRYRLKTGCLQGVHFIIKNTKYPLRFLSTYIVTMETVWKLSNILTNAWRWGMGFCAMIVEHAEYHKDNTSLQTGFRQSEDLQTIIKQLNQQFLPKKTLNEKYFSFILWGRSMGAITIINFINRKFCIRQLDVRCIILDSPFLSLRQLIREVGKKKFGAPNLLLDLLISYIDPLVRQKIGLSIDDFEFKEIMVKSKYPLILMASKNDGLIPQHHFSQLYDLYRGKKTFFYLDESHRQIRNQATIQRVFKALNKYALIQKNIQRQRQCLCLNSMRSMNQSRPKSSISCKKLSVTSRQRSLVKQNSQMKRKNIVTLRLYNTQKKQNKGENVENKKNNKNNKQRNGYGSSHRVRQFGIADAVPDRRIMNLQNLLKTKITIRKL